MKYMKLGQSFTLPELNKTVLVIVQQMAKNDR